MPTDADGVPAGSVTLAFLASGIEGIKVRITARAATLSEGHGALDREEKAVRAAIEGQLGDIVFGVDDESMEVAVAAQLIARGVTLGVAESLTGGLIASRLVNVPGASAWFRGGVVAYHEQVKFDVLGVPVGPVVSEAAAAAMARGVCRVTGSDVGLGITGVAGPDDQEGVDPGTIFVGLRLPDGADRRPGSSTSPATGNGCASTARSRPSTSCAAPSSNWGPDPLRPGSGAGLAPDAHSGATGGPHLGENSWCDPVGKGGTTGEN
jgi:PncC family amidohydrolase